MNAEQKAAKRLANKRPTHKDVRNLNHLCRSMPTRRTSFCIDSYGQRYERLGGGYRKAA